MRCTYLISETLNNLIASDNMILAIQKEESLTIKCTSVSYDDTSIFIDFADDLPDTQKADYLDGIITTHDGVKLEVHQLVENVVPVGGPKVLNKGFTFTATAGLSTVYDYTLTEAINVASGFMYTESHSILDSMKLELVHPIAGVLHRYAEGYPVNPTGITLIENEAVTSENLQGLIVRVTYTSTGGTDVKCNCGINGRLAE